MIDKVDSVQSIGILGGGQLGRMLSVAASRLGLRTHIFAPDADAPAGQVAHLVTHAEYEDASALARFAESVDVVTFEFENVPAAALDLVEERCPLLPRRHALAISQDRWDEKSFLAELGIATTPFANVEDDASLTAAVASIGLPAILKTRRFGYDGKGQVRVREAAAAATAWRSLDRAPAILEAEVDFVREVSVIGARSRAGEIVCYEPGENVHVEGILRTTTVPSRLSATERRDAIEMATRILDALGYVGVMGVEMFVSDDGRLLVNEIAPLVHNSGHWTQNGCVVDQFEQHIRAIAGWPLGDGSRFADIVMTNLIGDDVCDLEQIRLDPTVGIHLYGKAEVRPGRKMGHFNRMTQLTGPRTAD